MSRSSRAIAMKRLRALRLAAVRRNVKIGPGVRVGRWCRFIIDPAAQLVLGPSCEIDDGTTIAVYGHGIINIGAHVFVGHHCTLAARESIEIGRGAHLAELVSVRDHDHAVGAPPSSGAVVVGAVVIDEDAWLASKVTVLRDCRIGRTAVIGANAVVRGEIPPATTAVGVPARVVRTHTAES